MKILSTARNIVNTEEVETWLRQNFAERFPALSSWLNSVVRKWVIKNAPAVDTNITDTAGLPEWLRRAMQGAEKPQNIVLDDALRLRIQEVLDYMNGVVQEKPDTNLLAIGFDVAEQRSRKWHQRLRQRPTESITPEPENGTEIVISYPDGWSWRKILGKDAMIREGEIMGHCVGRLGYYEQVIRAKTAIVSLRDAQNVPHVTIEIDERQSAVRQIRGKQNQAVIDKYLPRVADFLKSRQWESIAFDGASPIANEVAYYHLVHSPGLFEAHGYRVVFNLMVPAFGASVDKPVAIVSKDKIVATARYAKAKYLRNVVFKDPAKGLDSNCCAMLRDFCYAQGLQIDASSSVWLLDGTRWTNNARGWCTHDNEAAQKLCVIMGKVDQILLLYDNKIEGWTKQDTLVLNNYLSLEQKQTLALECGITPKTVLFSTDWIEPHKPAPEFQVWLAKQNAGRTVKVDTDETLLNSLLTALNQPDVAAIKKGYLRLKNEDEITDQKLKALGFTTSGRSINAIGAVLLCSLPIKNQAPFKRYVFSKPNTLNCWQEVVSTPDHLSNALRKYGLTDVVVHKILELLRNEFLRLTPTKEELAELDLDEGVEMRVKKAMSYAASHKQDAARSKRLWASV
jgi:hypothetical protein